MKLDWVDYTLISYVVVGILLHILLIWGVYSGVIK